jgi:selenocysteine lyase/cysteine desulfurase
MPTRRSFIRQMSTALGALALHSSLEAAVPFLPSEPSAGSEDDFWRQIRMAYAQSPTIVNLNSGGVSPTPRAALEALEYYNRLCADTPSIYMWRILEWDREPLRTNLAALAGCSAEEIALNRNATESLNTVVFGLPLQRGDEVVLSKYDYPNMMNAWKQRELRDGIRLVWVDLELPSEDADALVQAYTAKMTDRTRLVHLTHIINWSGQLMPVRRIADAAHARGAEVLIDGAHSFALLDYKIPELGGDYFGTSLHKWLGAPIGNGLLWVKKEKIAGLWPLLSCDKPQGDNIRKFETLGTHSFAIEMATGYSLDLHNFIGTERKRRRLHYLKNYWMEKARTIPRVRLHTSMQEEYGCVIGSFSIEGEKGPAVAIKLFEDFRVHTVGVEWEKLNLVRVTPNVFTMTEDLDKLVHGIATLAAGGSGR